VRGEPDGSPDLSSPATRNPGPFSSRFPLREAVGWLVSPTAQTRQPGKDRVEGRGALPGPTRRPGNASTPRSSAKGPGKDAPRRRCQIFGIWESLFLACHFFLFPLPIGQDRRGFVFGRRGLGGNQDLTWAQLNRWDHSSAHVASRAITEGRL
jgi:hypothetical protein